MTPRKKQPPTPVLETELREGDLFLQMGDVDEALMRAARALSVAPDSPGALELADRAIDSSAEPLTKLALEPGVSFGVVALRARALAKDRRFAEASDLALQVASFRPLLPFAEWAPEWVRRTALGDDDAEMLISTIGDLVSSLQPLPGDGEQRNARAAIEVLAALPAPHRDGERASFLRTVLLRRIGDHDRAVREARAALARHDSWFAAIALGNAARDAGLLADAIDAFERATALDATDASAWVELTELHLHRGSHDRAAVCAEEALARDRGHPTAKVLLLFARGRLGDASAAAELARIARGKGPAAARARQLVDARGDAT